MILIDFQQQSLAGAAPNNLNQEEPTLSLVSMMADWRQKKKDEEDDEDDEFVQRYGLKGRRVHQSEIKVNPGESPVLETATQYLEKAWGFRLIFEFAENDYLANQVITKTYYYQDLLVVEELLFEESGPRRLNSGKLRQRFYRRLEMVLLVEHVQITIRFSKLWAAFRGVFRAIDSSQVMQRSPSTSTLLVHSAVYIALIFGLSSCAISPRTTPVRFVPPLKPAIKAV
ncbi:MAG: hypothetical protein LQ341_000598 [Variospora aurantia]|nr:MAG: hypothetical protein LQ341_000598 [Variospora aurantia]